MYVRVTVTPDARKEKVVQISEDTFEIAVREKAQRNQANRRVCEVLSERFNVLSPSVRIISGHRSPKKIISIET